MTGPQAAGGEAALAQFGYTQSMARHTGKFASFAVAFAFVSIATGIFTTYGAVLNSAGPVGIWSVTAVVLLLVVAAVRWDMNPATCSARERSGCTRGVLEPRRLDVGTPVDAGLPASVHHRRFESAANLAEETNDPERVVPRAASFKDAWLYVIVMVVIGVAYPGYPLARRGRGGLAMPDQHSIDAVLDHEAGTHQP